jgi:hypothetical protein
LVELRPSSQACPSQAKISIQLNKKKFVFRILSSNFAWLGQDYDYSIQAWDPISLEYQAKFGIRPLVMRRILKMAYVEGITV